MAMDVQEALVKLSYQVEYGFKTMSDAVSTFADSTNKRFELQDKKLDCIDLKLPKLPEAQSQDAKEGKRTVSSLPSNIKWFLVVVAGIALLGILGAAIGTNLLDHMKGGVTP